MAAARNVLMKALGGTALASGGALALVHVQQVHMHTLDPARCVQAVDLCRFRVCRHTAMLYVDVARGGPAQRHDAACSALGLARPVIELQ